MAVFQRRVDVVFWCVNTPDRYRAGHLLNAYRSAAALAPNTLTRWRSTRFVYIRRWALTASSKELGGRIFLRFKHLMGQGLALTDVGFVHIMAVGFL
jgi:hypothetical protein